MTQSKKYDFRVTKDDAGWIAEIIRRVTSKKTMITKNQGGFASETEAQAWAQNEVKQLLQNYNLTQQKKRRAKKEAQQ